ncbi:MAG: chemotaxis protein [Rhizobiales bacterium 32-66-8]|nr:MAG: chemotaxis protein [Rhizobiales bacterium 32-66-8]
MFGRPTNASTAATIDALNRSSAVIEFSATGEILAANKNFLDLVGYSLAEIKGKHHSLFVSPDYRNSPQYAAFWHTLGQGHYHAGEFLRVGKGGAEVWLNATYNPVLDSHGKTIRVIKFASDITAQKLSNAEFQGQIEAISKSQAVIKFSLDGIVLDANANFLNALGYRLEEILGQHHSLFVSREEKNSPQYREFWERLRKGEFQAAEYRRIGKAGNDVWIQATYNPILDDRGQPLKVIKFATDVTKAVEDRMNRAVIQKEIDADLGRISQALGEANIQAASASAATNQTAANVQSVAAGAEELAASVEEISRQVRQSRDLASAAVTEGARTGEIVATLNTASQKIGAVVELIETIAGQTNLLALNATIEAARAGEAGRGFSVVASEVKNLAGQTSKATSDIALQVQAVQAATSQAAAALAAITEQIGGLNSISSMIAAAVEEQTAVTREVSTNMQTAAHGVEAVKQNMSSIANSTQQVEEATRKVRTASAAIA